ncbi:hypothetical protein B0T21DRAFT_349456 [Apiosordaria backusii]|uniref:Uncharacterized protein n=1 Tax=Apiosordaria backusii TaxID=314023 RepID=A0AA40BDW7_9PEZI|nr:hypothetical protein B0T21DRAFT_349456 [Apiosordaria backusii]
MSGPTVFFIKASGHIGAAVLQALHNAQPVLSIRALVRLQEDVEHLQSFYQGAVTTVLGSLEDVDIVAEEAAMALLRPRLCPPPPSPPRLPGLQPLPPQILIQTSGAARIWPFPQPSGLTPHPKVWDDIADLDSFPTDTTHASQDIAVSSTFPGINTAIVSPTFVVGKFPSVRHKHPIIFPDLMHVTRQSSRRGET